MTMETVQTMESKTEETFSLITASKGRTVTPAAVAIVVCIWWIMTKTLWITLKEMIVAMAVIAQSAHIQMLIAINDDLFFER